MDSYKMETIYYISQTVAAIAVIGSLFYLARQIRLAHRAATDITRHGRSTSVQSWIMAIATNDDLTRCWIKAADNFVNEKQGTHPLASALGLTNIEAAKVELLCAYVFWSNWGTFASTKSPEDLRELKNIFASLYTTEPWATVWQLSGQRTLLDTRFVSFVDDVIREAQQTAATK